MAQFLSAPGACLARATMVTNSFAPAHLGEQRHDGPENRSLHSVIVAVVMGVAWCPSRAVCCFSMHRKRARRGQRRTCSWLPLTQTTDSPERKNLCLPVHCCGRWIVSCAHTHAPTHQDHRWLQIEAATSLALVGRQLHMPWTPPTPSPLPSNMSGSHSPVFQRQGQLRRRLLVCAVA